MRETVQVPENTKALVSVVMATYNEPAEIVGAAIKSILDQTYDNIELLIYDDSTEERTREAIDSFQDDDRVHVFREEKRVGFVRSLNIGLKRARGKFIARMDGDDIARPERLEKEAEYMELHPDVSVVGGQIALIDESGTALSSRRYPLGGVRLALFSTVRNPLAHPAVMIRRELVDAGFRYDESLNMSEDLDLWLRVMNSGYRVANIGDTVLDYRVGNDFAKKRTRREQVEYMAMVRRKNFDKHHLAHSILSCFSAWVYLHTPARVVQQIYKDENGQN